MAKVDAAKLKVIAKNHGLNEVHEAAIELERLRNQNGRLKVTIKKKDHVIRTIDHHNNRLNNDNVAKKSALESFHDKHGRLNEFLQERVSLGFGEHVVDVAMQHIQNVEEENKRLRESLEFYAKDSTYWYTESPSGKLLMDSDINKDLGDKARKALAGDSNATK